MALELRSSVYHFVRRVPRRYARVERRPKITQSLHTDSLEIAERKSRALWAGLIETWEARLAGDTADAEAAYEAARNIAQARGFRYLRAADVLNLPGEQLLARVLATADRAGRPNMTDARALLIPPDKPSITVRKALEHYWRAAADHTLGKSPDQVRRWRNPRIKAINNFVEVAGDLPLHEITPDDMQDFRDWWLERIKAGEVGAGSANKDFTHLAVVIRTVVKTKRLGLDVPLSGWSFREVDQKRRPSFSDDWIRDRILAPGVLNALNPDARGLLLGMVNTGYRPSEGASIRAPQIRLDAEVPHISIEPVGRTLKTGNARRVIPLLGVSLEAFRAHPDGFTRYADSASATQLINNYLANNGLKETPDHTLYSLRHAFQDRMIAAGIDDRIRRDLFGHALTEEGYGTGATLEHRARLMAPISF